MKTKLFLKDEHQIVIQVKDYFFVGCYLNDNLDIEEKSEILSSTLESIYNINEDLEPKILISGDWNIRADESDSSRKGELESIEELLLEFNITIKSDKSTPTCYNYNNNGWQRYKA